MSFFKNLSIKKTAIKVIADSKTNNTTMKKFDFFSKVLGRDITSENIAEVTSEEWEKIDAAKAEESTPPATSTLTEERVQEIVNNTLKTSMSSAITSAVTAAIKPIDDRLKEVEESAGASSTPTHKRDPKEVKTDSVSQANDAIEAALKAELGE